MNHKIYTYSHIPSDSDFFSFLALIVPPFSVEKIPEEENC